MIRYELMPELQLKSKSSKIVPPHFREHFNSQHPHNFISFPGGGYLDQKIAAHGSNSFLQAGHFKINRPMQLYAVTPKNELLIHYLLKGRVLCKLYNGDICVINEGDSNLFFSPAHARNYLFLEQGEFFSCHISVQGEYLKGFRPKHKKINEVAGLYHKGANKAVACPTIKVDYRMKMLLMELIHFRDDELGFQLFLDARLSELVRLYMHDLLKRDTPPAVNQKHSKLIKEVKEYIRFNLGASLSISILSKKHQVSMTALKAIFHAHEGKTINEFIIQERMHSAFSMLMHQDRGIREIGELVGYPEFSYFSYAFTKFFGHPPSYFRNNFS